MGKYSSYPEKTAPSNGDIFAIEDSAASGASKRITRGNFIGGAPLPADTVDTQAVENGAITTAKVGDDFIVQRVVQLSSAVNTTGTTMAITDTTPTSTNGGEFMTATITPLASTNKLKVTVNATFSRSTSGNASAFLLRDSATDAIAAVPMRFDASDAPESISFTHEVTAGSTAATIFKLRAAPTSGVLTFNGISGSRIYGAITKSSIVIEEYSDS